MENTNTAQDSSTTDSDPAIRKLCAITERLGNDAKERGEAGQAANVGLIIIAYEAPTVGGRRTVGIPLATKFIGPSALIEFQILESVRNGRSRKAAAELLRDLADMTERPEASAPAASEVPKEG